jgi:hypothetical protein
MSIQWMMVRMVNDMLFNGFGGLRALKSYSLYPRGLGRWYGLVGFVCDDYLI